MWQAQVWWWCGICCSRLHRPGHEHSNTETEHCLHRNSAVTPFLPLPACWGCHTNQRCWEHCSACVQFHHCYPPFQHGTCWGEKPPVVVYVLAFLISEVHTMLDKKVAHAAHMHVLTIIHTSAVLPLLAQLLPDFGTKNPSGVAGMCKAVG